VKKILLILVVWPALGLAGPVSSPPVALEEPSGAPDSLWHLRLAPYAWLTSTSGTIGAGPLQTDAGISTSSVLSHLQFAAMFVAEVGYGRWSFENDVIYARFQSSQTTPGPNYGKLKADLYQFLWTSYLGYRVLESERFTMDLQAGFRLISLGLDLELTPGLAPRQTRYYSRTWVDPVIGLRTRTQLTPWLFLPVRGDIGGFGANSDLTWEAFAGLGVQISRWAAFFAGYRALGYDYDQANFQYNVNTHGPLLGFEFSF